MPEKQAKLDAWVGIESVYAAHAHRFETLLRSQHNLTPHQYQVLRCVADTEGPVRMSDIVQALHSGSGAATNVVKRLEQRGLLHRRPDEEDARVVQVVLTPQGAEAVLAARADQHALVATSVPAFADEEQRRAVLDYLTQARGGTLPRIPFVRTPEAGQ